MSKIFLSIVIPCFDEMANLQKGVLDKVEHFLSKKDYDYEVIVVDDGSKDGSVDFIEDFCKYSNTFRLIKNQHLGKAGAVTAGVLAAKGEYILFTDMDQATPIEEIDKLLPFTADFDVVIGSRNSKRKGAPWTRLVMARSMMMLRRFIVGINGVSDTQCGFKMFRAAAAKALFTKMHDLHHGFRKVTGSSVSAGFDVELLFLAQKMGFSIKEVRINWLYVETRRVSPLKDSIDGFIDLINIKIADLKGRYN